MGIQSLLIGNQTRKDKHQQKYVYKSSIKRDEMLKISFNSCHYLNVIDRPLNSFSTAAAFSKLQMCRRVWPMVWKAASFSFITSLLLIDHWTLFNIFKNNNSSTGKNSWRRIWQTGWNGDNLLLAPTGALVIAPLPLFHITSSKSSKSHHNLLTLLK